MFDKAKVDALVNALVKGYDPDKIILLDTFAKRVDDFSVIDLCVVKEDEGDFLLRHRKLTRLVAGLDIKVKITHMQPYQIDGTATFKPMMFNVINEGTVVYTKS